MGYQLAVLTPLTLAELKAVVEEHDCYMAYLAEQKELKSLLKDHELQKDEWAGLLGELVPRDIKKFAEEGMLRQPSGEGEEVEARFKSARSVLECYNPYPYESNTLQVSSHKFLWSKLGRGLFCDDYTDHYLKLEDVLADVSAHKDAETRIGPRLAERGFELSKEIFEKWVKLETRIKKPRSRKDLMESIGRVQRSMVEAILEKNARISESELAARVKQSVASVRSNGEAVLDFLRSLR